MHRSRSWIVVVALCAVTGCERAPTAAPSAPQLSQVPRVNAHLTGTIVYHYEAVKARTVLANQVFPADVVLEFLPGDRFNMVLTEVHGELPVSGHMTPSGQFTMEFPFGDWLKDFASEHLGCNLNGPFPVWHGTYDGTRLLARTELNATCPVPWEGNDVFPTPVDGPVHGGWYLDVSLAPSPLVQASVTGDPPRGTLDNGNWRIGRGAGADVPVWQWWIDPTNGLEFLATSAVAGPSCQPTPSGASIYGQTVLVGSAEDPTALRDIANWSGDAWVRVIDTTQPGECADDPVTGTLGGKLVAYGWGRMYLRANDQMGTGAHNAKVYDWSGEGSLATPSGDRSHVRANMRFVVLLPDWRVPTWDMSVHVN